MQGGRRVLYYSAQAATMQEVWAKVDKGLHFLLILRANVRVDGRPSAFREHLVVAVRLDLVAQVVAGEEAVKRCCDLKNAPLQAAMAGLPPSSALLVLVSGRAPLPAASAVPQDMPEVRGGEAMVLAGASETGSVLQALVQACVRGAGLRASSLARAVLPIQARCRNRPLRMAVRRARQQLHRIGFPNWDVALDGSAVHIPVSLTLGAHGSEVSVQVAAPVRVGPTLVTDVEAQLGFSLAVPERAAVVLHLREAVLLREWALRLGSSALQGRFGSLVLGRPFLAAAVPTDGDFKALAAEVASAIPLPPSTPRDSDVPAQVVARAVQQRLWIEVLYARTVASAAEAGLDMLPPECTLRRGAEQLAKDPACTFFQPQQVVLVRKVEFFMDAGAHDASSSSRLHTPRLSARRPLMPTQASRSVFADADMERASKVREIVREAVVKKPPLPLPPKDIHHEEVTAKVPPDWAEMDWTQPFLKDVDIDVAVVEHQYHREMCRHCDAKGCALQ